MRPSPGAGRSGDSVSAFMARVYRFAARRRQVAIVSRLLRHSAVRHPWGSACRRCSALSSMPELHQVLATRVAERPAMGRVTLSQPVTPPARPRIALRDSLLRTPSAVSARSADRDGGASPSFTAAADKLRASGRFPLRTMDNAPRVRIDATSACAHPRNRAPAWPRGYAAGPRNVSSGIERAPDTMSGP